MQTLEESKQRENKVEIIMIPNIELRFDFIIRCDKPIGRCKTTILKVGDEYVISYDNPDFSKIIGTILSIEINQFDIKKFIITIEEHYSHTPDIIKIHSEKILFAQKIEIKGVYNNG